MKRTMCVELDNTMEKTFAKNKLEKNNGQALIFGIDGVKLIRVRENMSLFRSSIANN